jgi:hypothetical protein
MKSMVVGGLGLLAMVELVVALVMFLRARRLVRSGMRAEGVVVGKKRAARSGATKWAAVIEFEHAGQTHRFTDMVASHAPLFADGERIPVLFDPAAPARAKVESWMRSWMLPTTFFVMAGLSLLVAGIMAVVL